MLEFKQGNLLEEDAEALVNAANRGGQHNSGQATQVTVESHFSINRKSLSASLKLQHLWLVKDGMYGWEVLRLMGTSFFS
jgi:hypothetical protein